MTSYYLKLFVEILDDPKVMNLPDWAFRRFIEYLLVAKDFDQDGKLPPVRELAWRLHLEETKVTEGLTCLSQVGVVVPTSESDVWLIKNFAKRQEALSGYERLKEYRKRQKKKPVITKSYQNDNEDDNEDETFSSPFLSSDSEDYFSESFKQLVESASWTPDSPKEAEGHPAIRVYQEATGGRLPGSRDYRLVVDWVVQISRKYRMNGKNLPEYLNRWFTTWCSRKRAGGQPYDPGNIGWMEWAYNGQASPERRKGKDFSAEAAAFEAWASVRKGMAKYGHSREPEWEDRITAKVVESLGWRELCMSTNQASDRARFIQAYQAYAERAGGEPSLPQIKELAVKLRPNYGEMRVEEGEDV